MATGKVKWFSDAKGYGFIECDGDATDIFVHFSQIQKTGFRTLKQGQMVQFDLTSGERGPSAENVIPL